QHKPTAHPLHGCGVSLRGSEVAVSFIFTTPQALDNAAKSVSGIHDLWLADSKTAITVVNAIVPPAADPVSNRMVGRILEHMAQYQQISSQALEYLRGFSQGLAENAEAYRLAEAQNSTTFD
ncbi:PE family protein, partial [Mycobacterium tuberculosis]